VFITGEDCPAILDCPFRAKMFSDFSEGVALGYDGSGLWPVTILPTINVEEPLF